MTMRMLDLWSMIRCAPDDEGGSAPAPAEEPKAGGEEASPESILFGDDKPKDDAPAKGEGEGDDKPEDDKPEDGKGEGEKEGEDKDKSDDPADQVPEDGKYQLAMPEGVEVDQEMVDALGPEFKDLGLTNKQAQALADKFIEVQSKRAEGQAKEWGETVQKWADDAKADKEIGGDKWDGTVKAGRAAVERLGTPGLKEYLNATGGGNHPEVIRFMAKVGSMLREDDPAMGGAGGSGKPAEAAHVLFPNDAPKG